MKLSLICTEASEDKMFKNFDGRTTGARVICILLAQHFGSGELKIEDTQIYSIYI